MIRRPPRSTLFPRTTLVRARQVVRATEQVPLLLLVTYRDSERGDALLDTLADLRREQFLDRIVLGSLDERDRSEEHTSELQSRQYVVCRPLLEKKNLAPAPL